ncbi:diacylglycerol kinase family protein [Solobacterium moorei]|uniref:Diacylglycerol kinase family protein n=1 Tax=Solobacterium moorei TaxID=102148 RepID=A0A412PF39_9FIRM|nr:diacylglycerol kinase family protein [Solobacterium moorei]RGT56242.1 diacylglycerol kinase family protein [Solobacterium moorei]
MKNKFYVAFVGLVSSLRDKSVQIQYFLAILACIVAWIIGCNYYEWLAILLCIGLVVVTEILNTCIEKLCDLYSTERNEKIKYIKDLAAGGVLFASLIALGVGILVFIHHLI